ncbi:T9SS type A sorting domain-containing protein [uncultured Kordia sp.]|uniref:T9SS type A sorting domain-containing protein n=1 Tax=uncultured Kordia sp. TaxID=507699 RepID=UPI002632AD82|nr:T9SS type A sorting domain-containing protein [uncultured Kordia sp.]
MNSKLFTLTALFLFFIIKINAQNDIYPTPDIPISNVLDFTLLVEDTANGQDFQLLTDDQYSVLPYNDLFFKIDLQYRSEIDNVTFYRLACSFDRPPSFQDPNAPDHFFGITNPVLIPPVRKKKGGKFEQVDEILRPLGTYPYLAKAEYVIRPTIYKVTVKLLEYANFTDYINNSPHYTVGPTASFILFAQNSPNPTSERSTSDAFSVTTFPNPSTKFVTFKYTREASENTISAQLPLNVVIYNDKGIQVSQHTLTSAKTKINSIYYNLDTSHLQKGSYYFQLLHRGKTQVKTIVKQ